MKKSTILLIGAISCVFIFAGCGKKKETDTPNEKVAPADFAEAFLQGKYAAIYAQMSDAFKKEVSVKQLRKLGEEFNQDVTAYELQSELPYGEDATQYVWVDESETKGMVAVFDEENIIQGIQIMPIPSYPETDEVYTETIFDYPFEGEWFVFWGGTNPLVNYHYEYENQRYAYDFIIFDGKASFTGDPTINESYPAFGKSYLAPADGTIVAIENDIADNDPVGEMNADQPLGNYVIIDHGNNEFSYLAHFQKGSIEVEEGDQVKQGDLLGLVGNSGNSSEPHIHFHVADSADPTTSKSIRIQFEADDAKQGDTIKR